MPDLNYMLRKCIRQGVTEKKGIFELSFDDEVQMPLKQFKEAAVQREIVLTDEQMEVSMNKKTNDLKSLGRIFHY